MDNIFIKISSLFTRLKPYSWMLLPLIPFVLLLVFMISLFIEPTPDAQNQSPINSSTPTGTVSIPLLTPLPTDAWGELETEWEDAPETLPGFVRKEERSDGTIVYIYNSTDPDRPNITIRSKTNEVVFYRELGTQDFPLMKIPLIKETYGEPDQIIQGSTYYGSQTEIYFYESISTAYVVNPQTNETYEVQFFPPMTADEYLKRYKALN